MPDPGDSNVPSRGVAQRQSTCLAPSSGFLHSSHREEKCQGLAGYSTTAGSGWQDRQAAFLPGSYMLQEAIPKAIAGSRHNTHLFPASASLARKATAAAQMGRKFGFLLSLPGLLGKTHSCLIFFTPALPCPALTPRCPLPPSELGRWLQC